MLVGLCFCCFVVLRCSLRVHLLLLLVLVALVVYVLLLCVSVVVCQVFSFRVCMFVSVAFDCVCLFVFVCCLMFFFDLGWLMLVFSWLFPKELGCMGS